jgi:hypothetical protein
MNLVPLTQPVSGRAVYSLADQAFDFVPTDPGEVAARRGSPVSLALDTVLIEVGMPNGILLYVWGYSTRSSWLSVPGRPEGAVDGVVMVDEPALGPSGSVSIRRDRSDPAEVWWTQFDPESGWCRITRGGADGRLTRIATDTVIGTDDTGITSMWLKPTFVR